MLVRLEGPHARLEFDDLERRHDALSEKPRFLFVRRPDANRRLARPHAPFLTSLPGSVVRCVGVPLRHYLYPHADPRKVEELRYRIARTYEQAGHPNIRVGLQSSPIHFEVTDPESNETFPVHLSQYLTPRQLSKLSKRPDLILQFGHHLAQVKRAQGHDDIEVRAEVWVSMHARKFQLMVDPAVDLAAEPRSVEPASWIMPLVEPLPTTATPLF